MEERNAALTPSDGWEDSQSRHSLRPADTGKPQLSQLPIFPRSEGTTIGDPSDLCSSVWSSAGVCSLVPFEVLGLSASDFRTVSRTTSATRVSVSRADARSGSLFTVSLSHDSLYPFRRFRVFHRRLNHFRYSLQGGDISFGESIGAIREQFENPIYVFFGYQGQYHN